MFYGSYSVVTKDVPNLLSYHKVKTSGLEIFDPFKKKGGGSIPKPFSVSNRHFNDTTKEKQS